MPPADADAALDAIAVELYALSPGEFTASRNARAAASDRDLGVRVRALPKPTVAAWAVDRLAREGQLAEALELAGALREAQEDLDAAELARLGRQRRALVAALVQQAVELARGAGVTVSAAARDDVHKTINAAVLDPAAAAAVMTARLIRPLEAGTFEQGDLADALGGTVPGTVDAPPPDDLADRRARKAAEKAAREAERAVNEAERALADVEGRRRRARERAEHVSERIDDLRRDLERLGAESAALAEDLAALEREHGEAASRVHTASTNADRARRALDA